MIPFGIYTPAIYKSQNNLDFPLYNTSTVRKSHGPKERRLRSGLSNYLAGSTLGLDGFVSKTAVPLH